MNVPMPSTWTHRIALVGLAGVLVAGAGVGYALTNGGKDSVSGDPARTDRQAEVAARGAEVMPFDLDRTTHVFTKLPEGGVQTVTADDPNDAEQIRLVREHLRKEAEAFSRGDLSDPATIHGDDMPGVAELKTGAGRFTVRYDDQPTGARLVYTTDDPALIDALHAWFDAQTSDHGPDAEHG